MASSDITNALITYGLISDANKTALTTWFSTLFAEIQAGGGGNLLASSVAGRSFTFGDGVTVEGAFNSCARALNVLNGRSTRRSIMRF